MLSWLNRAERRLARLQQSQLGIPDMRAELQKPCLPGWLGRVGVSPVWCVLGLASVGAVLAGPAGGISVALLSIVLIQKTRARRAWLKRLRLLREFTSGLRLLLEELRAGAHPIAAAEGAAQDAARWVGELFTSLASVQRYTGDASVAVADHIPRESAWAFRRLQRAWTVAHRHGVGLANLLESARADLERTAASLRDLDAKLAGPRASAAVLSGLPVVGLLLGQATGAAPFAVLTEQTHGQVVLLVGAGLLGAGLLWTSQLTKAVLR